MAHHEPPHQDQRCLQLQLVSSLVFKTQLEKKIFGQHTRKGPYCLTVCSSAQSDHSLLFSFKHSTSVECTDAPLSFLPFHFFKLSLFIQLAFKPPISALAFWMKQGSDVGHLWLYVQVGPTVRPIMHETD